MCTQLKRSLLEHFFFDRLPALRGGQRLSDHWLVSPRKFVYEAGPPTCRSHFSVENVQAWASVYQLKSLSILSKVANPPCVFIHYCILHACFEISGPGGHTAQHAISGRVQCPFLGPGALSVADGHSAAFSTPV